MEKMTTITDEELLSNTVKMLIEKGQYNDLKKYIAHSDVTVYSHCIAVTKKCLDIVNKRNIKLDKNDLILASLLHDYYLYDWHINEPGRKLHGTHHQIIAAENAKRDYQVSEKIQSIIKTHMFPLPPQWIPNYKEAWVLTLADKIVATAETLKKYGYKYKPE